MNLDSLKPAWRKFRLANSMTPINQHDILMMLEKAEDVSTGKANAYLMLVIFVVMTCCCHGG